LVACWFRLFVWAVASNGSRGGVSAVKYHVGRRICPRCGWWPFCLSRCLPSVVQRSVGGGAAPMDRWPRPRHAFYTPSRSIRPLPWGNWHTFLLFPMSTGGRRTTRLRRANAQGYHVAGLQKWWHDHVDVCYWVLSWVLLHTS
jgi:hypothetical protein